jgi:excisionase family DNA binding protein
MAGLSMTRNNEIIVWGGNRDPHIWKLIIGCQLIHNNGNKFKIIGIKKGRYMQLLSEEQGTQHLYHLDKLCSRFAEFNITNGNEKLARTIEQLKAKRIIEASNEKKRMENGILTTREAAEFIGIDPSTLRDYARRKFLQAVKIDKGWRFYKSEIETWLQRRGLDSDH